jgi:DNA-binding NarL/FixJ family response regulator
VIKAIVCDDHPIFREGLKKIVSQSLDLTIADEVSDGTKLMEKTKDHHYDVVILDISLPGASGLDVLKDLRRAGNKMPVLILSMHPEEQYAVRALRAGASGYVAKASVPEELLTAIRKVAAGGKYISPSLAEQLASELDGTVDKPPHEKLSDREFQVMRMIVSGRRVKEIAADLRLSPATVGTYRARILAKLGLQSNAELIHYTTENKLLE